MGMQRLGCGELLGFYFSQPMCAPLCFLVVHQFASNSKNVLTFLAVVLNSATKVHKFASGNMLNEKTFCYK